MAQVTLGDVSYTVGRLPPRRALRLENRLLRVIGPGIVHLITSTKPGADGKVRLDDVDLAAVGAAVQGMLSVLTPDEQDVIMAELLETVQVEEGGKLVPVMRVFDIHFAGRLPVVFQLMWASLEENFGDFFGPLAAAAKAAGVARLFKVSSATQASGPSGGSS